MAMHVDLTAATLDHNGMQVLARPECLHLLTSVHVGRVGLVVNDTPVILPVNFVLANPPEEIEPSVVIAGTDGIKLGAAARGSAMAFETDEYDAFPHSGWSVLVQGDARVLEGPEHHWAAALPLRPWAIRHATHYVAIATDVISGRRFGTPSHPSHHA
ncbi:MAG: pyridoxamine 5'-phosphate oxidase family protein [Microthrixaceae bacterium]